jgi:formylglycine-generating enzyme required for sulfatase activity
MDQIARAIEDEAGVGSATTTQGKLAPTLMSSGRVRVRQSAGSSMLQAITLRPASRPRSWNSASRPSSSRPPSRNWLQKYSRTTRPRARCTRSRTMSESATGGSAG